MKVLCIAFSLALISISGYSQKSDTLRLFYGINQSALDTLAKAKLDVLASDISDKKAPLIIKGYADFLWKPDYNLILSEQRAAVVQNYLLEKGFTSIRIEGKGQIAAGKKYSNTLGEPLNRRVEILSLASAKKAAAPKAAPKPVEPVAPLQKPEFTYTVKPLSEAIAGESIVMEGLTFLPGRHVLRPEALPVLETLLGAMQDATNLKIEIQGHICCTPSGKDEHDIDTNEWTLSVNRAKTVYDYLVKNGIPANRMTYKGYAGSVPKVYPEVTEADKSQNRRVEILIVENKK